MPNGPWVQVATLCESVEPGPPLKLNVLVDTVNIEAPPGTAVPLAQLTLAVCLWADDLPAGTYTLRVQPHTPDGTMQEPITGQVRFPATGASGVNLIAAALPFTVNTGGDYWYDVLFVESAGDVRLLSRFPLTVNWTDA